jgi:hypothetical protein
MKAKTVKELLEAGIDSLEVSANHSIEDLVDLIHSADRMLKKELDPLLHTKAEYKKSRKDALAALKKQYKLSKKAIKSKLDESINIRYFLNEAFDVLTWSSKHLPKAVAKDIEEAHEGGFGEKFQTSLLKVPNKDELLKWYNKNFEVGEIQEAVDFKRTRDSKKNLNIGNRAANRDRRVRMEQLIDDIPEAKFAYSSSSHLEAPGEHPNWQIINVPLSNSEFSLEENKEKYLNWTKDNTDYDIIEAGEGYERSFHPFGNESKPKIYDQNISIRMRNEADVS